MSNARIFSLCVCMGWVLSACVVFEEPIRRDAGTDAGPMDAGPRDSGAGDAGAPDAGVDAGSDAGFDAGPYDAGMDAGPTCVVASITTVDNCAGDIVINEVDGSGEDFVEIYNRGTTPVDISGWIITDSGPRVSGGAVVPDGFILNPGSYLYVWANLPAPQPGLRETDCIPGTPPPCLHWNPGISATGELTYILDRDLNVICEFNYPGQVFAGEAFGRIPSGSTQLCPTIPTPGYDNNPSFR